MTANSSTILGLLAETSIHAGAGSSVGVIDLPIQREAHTDWPVVYGSSVKGALRARAEDLSEEVGADWIVSVFGPDTSNASLHAGSLIVSDARLLLLPVRSMTTHFKWVTCPALLRRYDADRRRLGLSASMEIPNVDSNEEALVASGDGNIFLEEFRFAARAANLAGVTEALLAVMPNTEKETLEAQLAIVSDDVFRHVARHATPVAAHVRLESETKTVAPGALWYEESLPADTLLYTCLAADRVRGNGGGSGSKVLEAIRSKLFARPYLLLGGNETTGMGWCRVRFAEVER